MSRRLWRPHTILRLTTPYIHLEGYTRLTALEDSRFHTGCQQKAPRWLINGSLIARGMWHVEDSAATDATYLSHAAHSGLLLPDLLPYYIYYPCSSLTRTSLRKSGYEILSSQYMTIRATTPSVLRSGNKQHKRTCALVTGLQAFRTVYRRFI